MKYRPFITETFIFIMICVCLITFAFAVSRPNEDIDLEDEYDLIGVKDYIGSGNMSVGGDHDVTGDQTVGGDSTTTGAIGGATLDTGQGANELYDMDQNVKTSNDVTYNKITATTWIYSADQVYGVEWNGELSVPTKNAVYDKVEVVNTAVGLNTSKVTESTSVTAPLVLTTYDVSIPVATTSADGYLSQTDWDVFTAKQNAITISAIGDIVYSADGSTLIRLPVGTENQILAVDAASKLYYVDMPTGGSGGNSFETMDVDNGTDPVADSSTDTLTWTSGTGIKLTGDSALDKITAAVSDAIVTQLNASGYIYALAKQIAGGMALYCDKNGNVGIGISDFGDVATKALGFTPGEPPPSGEVDMVMLYAKGADSATKLLLHLNGADGATSTIDSSESNHTITFVDNAQLDTGQTKFGTTSLLLDGAGDRITVPDHADWAWGGGDFTIDFWVRFNDRTGQHNLCYQRQAEESPYWYLYKPATNTLAFTYRDTGVGKTDIETDGSMFAADNTWYHVEFVRNGANAYIFLDGTSQALTIDNAWEILDDVPSVFNISSSSSNEVDGWIDEFRVSKGIARHTANFTAPTTEYSGTDNVELYVMDENSNETQLSPHDFSMIPETKIDSYFFPWSYSSQNVNIGRKINVDMYGAIKALEKISGEKFIYEQNIGIRSMQEAEEKRLDSWVRAKRNKELQFRKAQRLAELERIANLPITENDEPDTGIIP